MTSLNEMIPQAWDGFSEELFRKEKAIGWEQVKDALKAPCSWTYATMSLLEPWDSKHAVKATVFSLENNVCFYKILQMCWGVFQIPLELNPWIRITDPITKTSVVFDMAVNAWENIKNVVLAFVRRANGKRIMHGSSQRGIAIWGF